MSLNRQAPKIEEWTNGRCMMEPNQPASTLPSISLVPTVSRTVTLFPVPVEKSEDTSDIPAIDDQEMVNFYLFEKVSLLTQASSAALVRLQPNLETVFSVGQENQTELLTALADFSASSQANSRGLRIYETQSGWRIYSGTARGSRIVMCLKGVDSERMKKLESLVEICLRMRLAKSV